MKQLRRFREVTALGLEATDGELGAIEDVLIDDRSWTVRYLVVKTGGWLLGRDVLIAPIAIREIDDAEQKLKIGLTREQVEHSPPIDRATPVSRAYEQAYYQHFNWAPYWEAGPTAWGASAVPFPATPSVSIDPALLASSPEHVHVRSAMELSGYALHAKDGAIGHVEDVVIDDEEWAVRYVEVDTRNWLPGKKVLVQTSRIGPISWAERSVGVSLTRQAIQSAPAYDPSRMITPDYEVELFKYYGKTLAA